MGTPAPNRVSVPDTMMALPFGPPWWFPKPLYLVATLGGTSHGGASRKGKKPPPTFEARRLWELHWLFREGTDPGWHGTWAPTGVSFPPTRHFGCSNNPSFSPRRISPEVQQSSFYGYTGLLPKRYTQGVMTGESKYLHLCPCSTVGAHSWGDDPLLLSLRAPASHTRGPTVPSTAWPGCQQIMNTPGCFPANQGV